MPSSIEHPDVGGLLVRSGRRWGYARQWFPDAASSADFSPARWSISIRACDRCARSTAGAARRPGFTLTGAVATAFRSGPGFGWAMPSPDDTGGRRRHEHRPARRPQPGLEAGVGDTGMGGRGTLAATPGTAPTGVRNVLLSLRPDVPNPAGGLTGDLGVIYARTSSPTVRTIPPRRHAGRHPPGPGAGTTCLGRVARPTAVDAGSVRRRMTLLVPAGTREWVSAVGQARADVPITRLPSGAS